MGNILSLFYNSLRVSGTTVSSSGECLMPGLRPVTSAIHLDFGDMKIQIINTVKS
jgi:hypothetical protein